MSFSFPKYLLFLGDARRNTKRTRLRSHRMPGSKLCVGHPSSKAYRLVPQRLEVSAVPATRPALSALIRYKASLVAADALNLLAEVHSLLPGAERPGDGSVGDAFSAEIGNLGAKLYVA